MPSHQSEVSFLKELGIFVPPNKAVVDLGTHAVQHGPMTIILETGVYKLPEGTILRLVARGASLKEYLVLSTLFFGTTIQVHDRTPQERQISGIN
jgi:hypothetical protein